MLRVIDEIRPAWVIGENVAGITTMVEGGLLTDVGCHPSLFGEGDDVHEYVLRETFTIERICSDLERVGYSVQPVLIPAAAVEASHRRDRVFFIAYDSHRGVEMRGAGEDESESESERIPERDTLQRTGESNKVRSEAGISSSYPHGNRRDEVHEHLQPGQPNGPELERHGGERTPADSHSHRYSAQAASESAEGNGRRNDGEPEERSEQAQRLERLYQLLRSEGDGGVGKRWAGFPTVSPIHRGNDGLPFSLDDLTIPATRWRTESLKAYGNAIVPQVMYEIFRAIEMVEQ